MVECWHPRECALLINILGAKCPRCFVQDPRVKAEIQLAMAKANPARRKQKAPRKLSARGLQDAKRARNGPAASARERTIS